MKGGEGKNTKAVVCEDKPSMPQREQKARPAVGVLITQAATSQVFTNLWKGEKCKQSIAHHSEVESAA